MTDGAPTGAELLAQREATHGNFADAAETAQAIKDAVRRGERYARLTPARREALDGIAVKIARIVNGNGAYADHWDDIAGWASGARKHGAPRE